MLSPHPRYSIKGRRKFQEVRALLGILFVRAGDARAHQVTSQGGAADSGELGANAIVTFMTFVRLSKNNSVEDEGFLPTFQ